MVHRESFARTAVVVACGAGLLHAIASLYWALGGPWLLGTVGEWAVELVEKSPLGAGLLLGLVALVKAAAAIVPVLVHRGGMPWPRLSRGLCWIGGPLLVVYGAINVVVSGAVLAGLIEPEGGYDTAAMVGHAFLWDPLFLIWGAALVTWLWLTAVRRLSTEQSS